MTSMLDYEETNFVVN